MTAQDDRLTQLEARIDAMSATIKSVLTTLVLRGLLTKPAVDQILRESEQALGDAPAAKKELDSVREDLPNYIRAAAGPESDPDDHGH